MRPCTAQKHRCSQCPSRPTALTTRGPQTPDDSPVPRTLQTQPLFPRELQGPGARDLRNPKSGCLSAPITWHSTHTRPLSPSHMLCWEPSHGGHVSHKITNSKFACCGHYCGTTGEATSCKPQGQQLESGLQHFQHSSLLCLEEPSAWAPAPKGRPGRHSWLWPGPGLAATQE